ncbi:ABC transporter ATP-binding protein [Phytoactinopolyspora mesophila]|uniref:ATP-binding cassette domain-containing protein n=1 Tax=Phytoactinopolyspora mesophila TaxID=2650750 RepID=A0A7K3M3X7_9ACTN|nr:ABC transporter ATP-binding protein [Phytoactinopolyspora mesophila]NDL58023.1 ATP-binding cassette domain-containing protein [Phytoactinopolyspora mesophila]
MTSADPSAAVTPPVVEMTGVSRSFPGPPEVQAVRDVNVTIWEGEYVSIIGPSGSGKSTLLHLLGLLDRPTTGTYRLDGVDVSGLSEARRSTLRGERIGFVFQAFHLLPHRSVLENVGLSMLYRRVPKRERLERSRATLERVGLGHRIDFEPTTLSGGERQRVAIARALVAEPSLLLADEPTGNLDSGNAEAVLEVFDKLHAEGLTLAVITHDDDVSHRADRRVRITDGTLSEGIDQPVPRKLAADPLGAPANQVMS